MIDDIITSRYYNAETPAAVQTLRGSGPRISLGLHTADWSRNEGAICLHSRVLDRKMQWDFDPHRHFSACRKPCGSVRSVQERRTMGKRLPISKRTRFEVLKRDNFTCRYCGARAPDVVLEIDHVKPVAGGGCGCLSNLVTACHACNRGKGVTVLGDLGKSGYHEIWSIANDCQNRARLRFDDPHLYIADYVVTSLLAGRMDDRTGRIDYAYLEKLPWLYDNDEDGKDDFIWHLRCDVELYVQSMECPL